MSDATPGSGDARRQLRRVMGFWDVLLFCIAAGLGLAVVTVGIVLSFVPPGDASSTFLFETKLVAGTVLWVLLDLALYFRGARLRAR